MAPFRVAVLECDTPVQAIRKQHGTYGDIFRDILQEAFKELSPPRALELQFTKWDVVGRREYPQLDQVDAILLSGSKHDSFLDHEWIIELVEFVRTVHETSQKPLVGICFGHQIIGRALGAQVGRSPGGWEVAVNKVDLSEKGREIFGSHSLAIHQMHRDAVLSVPKGLDNLGCSESCGVQGLYCQKRILTLQAHPEFNQAIMQGVLDSRHEEGVFSREFFTEAASRAGIYHDGLRITTSIWKFLLE